MDELTPLERTVLSRLPAGVFRSANAEVDAARYIADAVEQLHLRRLRMVLVEAERTADAAYKRGMVDAARRFRAEVEDGRRRRPSPGPRHGAAS